MVVAVAAGVLGLLAVLLASVGPHVDPPADPDPGWDPLPAPNDVARPDFPLAFPGYDPATVDATVEALLVAYEELYAAASPEARARASRGAARRRGEEQPLRGVASGPLPVSPAADVAGVDPGEALRAAAALATLEREARRRGSHAAGQPRSISSS